jgi:hypothetical protein
MRPDEIGVSKIILNVAIWTAEMLVSCLLHLLPALVAKVLSAL